MSSKLDPTAYIETALLDGSASELRLEASIEIPILDELLAARAPQSVRSRGRRTAMRAPRPRRSAAPTGEMDAELLLAVERLPGSLAFLLGEFDDRTTERSYKGGFSETRRELVRRLIDPELSLEESARLLGVCPATVRRYTNRGWLAHHRTPGGQRRFRLSAIVAFVTEHGRLPQETPC